MNQSGPEAYFSHFHIREILDHFVCTYVRNEQDNKERAQRSYLLKNTSTDTVEENKSSEKEEDYSAINPQLKAIVLLRQYLETYQSEEKSFKSRHPYVVFVSSVLPTDELTLEAWKSSPATAGMQRVVDRLVEDSSVRAEVYTPKRMSSKESPFPIDSPESQKTLDRFRVRKAGEIGGVLNTQEKSLTILVAREWPSAVADTLAVEHVLGLPQMVVHFGHPVDDVAEEGGFERNPGVINSIQDTSRRVHAVGVEAGRFNKPRERAALLGYYSSRDVLLRVEVSEDGEPLTPELVEMVVAKCRECRTKLDAL